MNKEISDNNPKEKSSVAKREEEMLRFWEENNIFKKSEQKSASRGEYVFYDGPPFATGLPHYGHILASTIKDAIPRYQTMRGHRVIRRWGWDCHGLPLENEVEKELNLKTKKDIEELGIGNFNEVARNMVLRYADDWKQIIPRMGRWVDMENDYKTMDTAYTESVWWIFKSLYDKKLIYKGFKSMHLCPRCGTTLSNFEVNLGYKDITDLSVYVKLKLKDEPDTFLLAWTTTPWTLPGNMAAAVNKDVTYVKVKTGGEQLILAKDRLSVLDGEYEVVEEIPGTALVGKSYHPPFTYYEDKDLEQKKTAWKVYHAPYVTTEDGTGIVHLAPAFGEEDLLLAQKEGIPVVHHVHFDGRFAEEVADFKGMLAKPKDNPQETDIEIIKHLAHDKYTTLYKKEKVTHSYPHCWRCDTPLLNYATSSWFVRVTDFKDKLVSENKKVGWVPKEVGENRFGKWLEGARDWAISRTRYWGAPLPVWVNEKTEAVHVMGSIEDLRRRVKRSGNTYVMIRHGESESNMKNIVDSALESQNGLTEKGRTQIREAVSRLKEYAFDIAYVSPLQRTQETFELISKEVSFKETFTDNRLREISFGSFNGRSRDEYWKQFNSPKERFDTAVDGGETVRDVRKRVGEFIYEIERKHEGKTILIVAHEDVLWMLTSIMHGVDADGALALKGTSDDFFKNGEVRELPFVLLPHNKEYELDLHRPYIDEIELVDADGTKLTRVPDVFDCWFESGSMPYGQQHYPFENTDTFDPKGGWFSKSKGYPADFIAEGVDQTRGWFYSLIVLGVALFGKAPYRHVIVNGLVQAEDGKKMSKRLKNYPDPMDVVDRYGADALRYYLLSSPIVRGEDLNFSEKGVDEVMKKLTLRLSNVYSFYELYKDEGGKEAGGESPNMLDRWILSRLHLLTKVVTDSMEQYELDRATRPFMIFVDDFSTWYLRRSRERFKGDDAEDKAHALKTIRFVLKEFSKLAAPFMPFYAEALYQDVKEARDPESVHLCEWPEAGRVEQEVLDDMALARDVVSLGLEARARAGIKVRQPLGELKVKNEALKGKETFLELIKDEVNVKSISFDSEMEDEAALDTAITEELKREGMVRDLIRKVQDMRKQAHLSPGDVALLSVGTNEKGKELFSAFENELKRASLLSAVSFDDSIEGETLYLDGISFTLSLNPKS